jgi:hypothetical protein
MKGVIGMELFKIFGTIALNGMDKFDSDVGNATSKGQKLASAVGNGLAKAAKVGAVAVGAAATAVAGITKQSLDSYAEYEQLAGGAQLLFGDAYGYVADQAANAFSTVQMSQNEYLQQVNGFATGLKTALGGNEQAAAELAAKIIQAEADVVAATGNTQENVQNAFNGIMKGNYTMLDNLQLGITPTKEGFQEVIDKVNDWNKANGNATKYQIDNLADCQSALVDYIAMQGLSGYAASEAAGTITGSLSMVKASWSNWLTSLASGGDMQQTTQQLFDSVMTAANNILPVIQTVLTTLISTIQTQAPEIINTLLEFITSNLPQVITAGVGLLAALITGLISAIPDLVAAVPELITALVDTLAAAWPQIEQAGKDAFNALWNGIKGVWDSIVSWFQGVWQSIFGNLSINVGGLFDGSGLVGLFDGSHATGLDYVPFDGYIAQLHKGESVLTASEAAAWRSGKGGAMNTAQSAPQEIVTNITLELDGAVLARQLFRHNKTVTNDRGLAFVRG